MARPQRTGEDPEHDEEDASARRPRERAQLRAALALEEAGELQEAARMFEYVGEHAQAASLRLEHADTLRDEQQRLAVLREGCARNPASSVQGQALHRALGEALLRVAEGLEPGARRRALALEAAQALEDGQRPAQAGRLYEQLGLLTRATKAYTEAGEIERLESVLEVLEQREQRQRKLRELELEVEGALSTGRRGLARALLEDHVREAQRDDRTPAPSLAQALNDLERRRPKERVIGLSVRELDAAGAPLPHPAQVIRIVGRPRLRLGRGPQCELCVSGAAISREHAVLVLSFSPEGRPQLAVRDLGSRAGSFLDGEVLVPGEDWPLRDNEGQRELALGIASSFELWPLRDADDPRPLALVREDQLDGPSSTQAPSWTLFVPLGGPLWSGPEQRLPLTLEFEGETILARAQPNVSVSLEGSPIGPGEAVELLVHDRLRLEALAAKPGQPAALEIEVRPLW